MSQLSNRIAEAFINYANAFKETPENRVLAEKELKESLHKAIDFVPVKIWLDPKVKAKIPEYAHYMSEGDKDGHAYGHATDAACDVVCTSIELKEDGRIVCGTGIHVATEYRDEISIFANSRFTKTKLVMQNLPPTIDESYRGEIFIVFRKLSEDAELPKIGDVIGQLKVPHDRQICWDVVDKLEDLGTTDRGDGGFGSTSKK